jgi:oxygen-independent coproporphyrinogen-3 oxidase
LYLHVPFCFHKCHYCDFYSIVDTRDRQGEFTKRLIAEVRALAKATQRPRLATIFVGGGTPSLLAVGLWQELLAALAEAFDL